MEEFIRPFTEPFNNLDTLQEQLKECQVTLLCVAIAEAVVDCTEFFSKLEFFSLVCKFHNTERNTLSNKLCQKK
jgi:hypothetical protein